MRIGYHRFMEALDCELISKKIHSRSQDYECVTFMSNITMNVTYFNELMRRNENITRGALRQQLKILIYPSVFASGKLEKVSFGEYLEL